MLSDSEIGSFKNELEYKEEGIVKSHKIVKAYFFVKKFYAYKVDNGTHKTIVSGVPKNFLSWDQVEAVARGETLELDLDTFFYKSLTNLSVTFNSKKKVIKHHSKNTLMETNTNSYLH